MIAQFGNPTTGFTIVQRQDEVVVRFADPDSELITLSAEGLVGLQRFGSYDQIVLTFGTDAGDPNELDAALYLNGNLAESITDVDSIQINDLLQASTSINLGQPVGLAVPPGTSNFGGELGLFRVENTVVDACLLYTSDAADE